MDFENEENDKLKFQHLAGAKILESPPLYAKTGEHLLFLNKNCVNIYSTTTGQFVRKLEGSSEPLIDFAFELQNDDHLVACNNQGEIFTWSWKIGKLENTITVPKDKENMVVTNFKLLNLYGKTNLPYAFICYKVTNESIQWRIVDRSQKSYVRVPCDMKLSMKKPLVAVDNKNFPTLVVAQGHFIYFLNYRNWKWLRLMNAHKVPITVVQVHPTEECVATGDEIGKIMLWRQFTAINAVRTSLYHWHHTQITSICFTVAGAHFYSSGEEAVLVKWHVENPEMRQFLPRMVAKIRHIAVSPNNTNVAVCTADNSVQIVGSENKIHQNLQEFTYIPDNKTGNSIFPTGLRLNPRNNSLVLNGRTGCLQFYNTYTKNLLYNVNIVNQNILSEERDRILYDIRVTKAAFNIDWMATGEVFNDEEHMPELRLKFWKYREDTQNYVLNTNIEFPHEGGFKAIEFSNDYQVDNLLCATIGEDNIIKMWSLEDSDNICKKGKTWYCIAQTSYKGLPVDAISFSQDGSLLAAGYGNTLCIYKSDNLKLKAALTGANGLDGCASKAQIRIPIKNINGAKSELLEQRKKIMQLFTNMLETNEETLIKQLQNVLNDKKLQTNTNSEPLASLDDKQKTNLYAKILKMHELNLFQKVLLYQKLGIACKVHPQMETKLAEYISKSMKRPRDIENKLSARAHKLNLSQRFKAKYRLDRHFKQQKQYDEKITNKLVPIMSLLNITSTTGQKKQNMDKKKDTPLNLKSVVPPKPVLAEITHVQFAAGEYAHLVVVCTERRVLIWNLLTLRLQSVLKLSVKHLTFDPQTNLVAVVTQNDELHLFQPNVPLPIYQRRNLPKLHGIAWIPRRQPKQRSINLDWQAQSTLYFLTEDQDIYFLSSPSEKQSDVPAPVQFDNVATESVHYSTFGTYATKSVTDKETSTHYSGPLVLGNNDKTAVRALIDMSVHTMPPMSLICEDFIKSMVTTSDAKSPLDSYSNSNTSDDALTTRLNGEQNGYDSHSDTEDENTDDDDGSDRLAGDAASTRLTNGSSFTPSHKIRKALMSKTEELKRKQKALGLSDNSNHTLPPAAHEDQESKLRSIAKLAINLDF